MNTADHPENPFGSASFCAALAQASRRFLGSDDLGFSVPVARGASTIEPSVTSAADILPIFPTWTDFENDCGLSRLWGGVHFRASLQAGRDIGRPIGDPAYQFVQDHILGNAGPLKAQGARRVRHAACGEVVNFVTAAEAAALARVNARASTGGWRRVAFT